MGPAIRNAEITAGSVSQPPRALFSENRRPGTANPTLRGASPRADTMSKTGSLAALLAAGTLLAAVPLARADGGSFTSSDPLLNRIWAASVTTATDMLAPGPLTTDSSGDACPIDVPVAILDGEVRDRCPYIGDEAVTGMTLLVSTPSAQEALKDELLWFASAQAPDGAIPASPAVPANPAIPLLGGQLVLFDYPSFWVQCLYDYVLYTGDLSILPQVWPNLVELMDVWYPSKAGSDGLLSNDLGPADYAFIRRQGTVVAYFNAGYVLALKEAAKIATWAGETENGAAWEARAVALSAPFNATFFDRSVGAYVDSPTGTPVHPQDGNVFAILAGLSSPQQATSALAYLSKQDTRPWGNTIADNNTWDDPVWGSDAEDRVYPFIGYFEVLARFDTSMDDSAIDLIRREWGWMLTHGPKSTMWEDISAGGGPPRDSVPSFDHGWSSGAAPALTSYLLGVRPTSPGFATFVVDPHPGSSVTSASGVVPTPNGDLTVSWTKEKGRLAISVEAPPGESWTNRPAAAAAARRITFRGTIDATVGRSGGVTLTSDGKAVASLNAGRYALAVVDANAQAGLFVQSLHGRPVTIAATAFTGKKTVELTLQAGRWTFFSNPGSPTHFVVT